MVERLGNCFALAERKKKVLGKESGRLVEDEGAFVNSHDMFHTCSHKSLSSLCREACRNKDEL